MKRIILSEGENDTIFLRELLTTKIGLREEKLLFFDQDTRSNLERNRFAQQHYFTRLEEDSREYEILAKSEAGKDKIVAVTGSQLPYLCTKRRDPIMLIDMDNDTVESFHMRIEAELGRRFRHFKLETKHTLLDKCYEAEVWLTELIRNKRVFGKMYTIAFNKSLEDVIGILSREDSKEEKEYKVRIYLKKSDIHKIFSIALTS